MGPNGCADSPASPSTSEPPRVRVEHGVRKPRSVLAQQPGVIDEMANAIVRQVNTQRIVTNDQGPGVPMRPRAHLARGGRRWQRMYAVHVDVGTKQRKQQPCWGDVVHFSSAKAAAEAFVPTAYAEADNGLRAIFVRIMNQGYLCCRQDSDMWGQKTTSPRPLRPLRAELLISSRVHTAVYKVE